MRIITTVSFYDLSSTPALEGDLKKIASLIPGWILIGLLDLPSVLYRGACL